MMINKNVYSSQATGSIVDSSDQQLDIKALTNSYRQKSFDKFGVKGQLPDEKTAEIVGCDILESMIYVQRGDTITNKIGQASDIDLNIVSLSKKIADEMSKSHPNWTSIDQMIRDLAVFLQRKSGREELKISQDELDHIKKELKNVLSTYNDISSLCINIACGTISVVAGCIGASAAVTGIAQLANGATKASALVNTAQGLSTAAGSVSQGIHQSVGKYFENNTERQRTFYNYQMQRAKDNKDAALQAAAADRQGMESAKNTSDRVNEAKYQAFVNLARAGV